MPIDYKDIVSKLSDVQIPLLGHPKSNGKLPKASSREIVEQYDLPAATLRKLAAKTATGDRSKVLWRLTNSLLENGVSPGETVVLLEQSVWNKFGEDRGRLWADVNKAAIRQNGRRSERHRDENDDRQDISMARYLALETKDPRWMVEGLWADCSHGIIAGEPKTRKSYIVLDIAVSVATGTKCLGCFPVRQAGPVLLIQEELQDAEQKKRMRHIAKSKGWGKVEEVNGSIRVVIPDVPLFLHNREGFDLSRDKDKEEIQRKVKAKKIKLLILDHLQMMLGEIDENQASDVRRLLVWLLHLKEVTGCAIILVHHFGKNSDKKGGQRMLGSQAFHAWTDSALFLSKPDDLVTRVEREFRNFEPLPDFSVDYVGEEGEYEVEVTENRPKPKPNKFERTCLPLCGKPIGVVSKLLAIDRRTLMKRIRASEFLDTGKRQGKMGRPMIVMIRKRPTRNAEN